MGWGNVYVSPPPPLLNCRTAYSSMQVCTSINGWNYLIKNVKIIYAPAKYQYMETNKIVEQWRRLVGFSHDITSTKNIKWWWNTTDGPFILLLLFMQSRCSAYFEKFDVVVHFLLICESKYSSTRSCLIYIIKQDIRIYICHQSPAKRLDRMGWNFLGTLMGGRGCLRLNKLGIFFSTFFCHEQRWALQLVVYNIMLNDTAY